MGGKTEFSWEECEAFAINGLQTKDFIQAGDKYFKLLTSTSETVLDLSGKDYGVASGCIIASLIGSMKNFTNFKR